MNDMLLDEPASKERIGLVALALWLCAFCASGAGAAPVVRQDELPADLRLPAEQAALVVRVVQRNRALLGAHGKKFCAKTSGEERQRCVQEVDLAQGVEVDGPIDIVVNGSADHAGREWPNRESVSGFQRIHARVPVRKGARKAEIEATLLAFDSRRDGKVERCVFPFEHWAWSAMDRPERFAAAPVGICGGNRELTVTEYFLEQAPDAAPWTIRFLSEPEARAWASGDPERIKYKSQWTAEHEYAKYFLLESMRWWRGGRPESANASGYAFAVRHPHLPIAKVRELERNGDVFLDIFEDGAQIELTTVTRKGLEALLAQQHEVLKDASLPEDRTPRLVPLEN